jgi:hypothetical protein
MAGMTPVPAADAGGIDLKTYLGLFAFVLVAHALWYLAADPPPGFADSDGYVRLLRVEALWRGGTAGSTTPCRAPTRPTGLCPIGRGRSTF